MKTAMEIINANLYPAAVELMDDGIREFLADNMTPCSDEAFLSAYMALHLEKYGEEFDVN